MLVKVLAYGTKEFVDKKEIVIPLQSLFFCTLPEGCKSNSD